MADVEAFRDHVINSGYVLDPEGEHSEFVSGMHGQKLDFDTIETGSELYQEWVQANNDFLIAELNDIPEVLLGVANGTNRLSEDVARNFHPTAVTGLVSEKDPQNSKILRLTKVANEVIRTAKPNLVIVLEDVGTTGSNSVQVAAAAHEAGAKDVLVVPTWKRRERLERLDEAGIRYQALIDEPLPTYTPEACREIGFCALGWKFKPRNK